MPYDPPEALQPLVVSSPSARPAAYPTVAPSVRVAATVPSSSEAPNAPEMTDFVPATAEPEIDPLGDATVFAAGGTFDPGTQQLTEPTSIPTAEPEATPTTSEPEATEPTATNPTPTPSATPTPSPVSEPTPTPDPTVQPGATPTHDVVPGSTGSNQPNQPVAAFLDPNYEPSPTAEALASHPILELLGRYGLR